MSRVHIFVSFDGEHDTDLHDLLIAQSTRPGSTFEVSSRSQRGEMTEAWEAISRSRIRAADEVVVICGEHTDASPRVAAELRIAQEENRPYFLLWGRRELMCTKPVTAKPADAMYSWTPEILRVQILTLNRAGRAEELLAEARRARGNPKQPPVEKR